MTCVIHHMILYCISHDSHDKSHDSHDISCDLLFLQPDSHDTVH